MRAGLLLVEHLLFLRISQVLSALLPCFMNHVIKWPLPGQSVPKCGLTGFGLGSGFWTTPHASAFQWELAESLLCARLHAV